MHNLIQLVQERSSLPKLAHIFHATLYSEVRRHVDELQNSPINHLEMLGVVLNNLSEQDEKHGHLFRKNVTDVLQSYDTKEDLIAGGSNGAYFVQKETQSLI